MSVVDGKIVKEGIDEQGRSLAVREKAWYKYVEPLGFSAFPKIYDYEPFTMEKVEGKNIYEYDELSKDEKREILAKIIGMLKNLHSLESGPVDYYSMKEAYVTKTWDRLNKIRNLVPFANDEYITVNGKRCHNIFYITDEVEERVNAFDVKEFKLLHGDNTFSNMMLRNDTEPIVIDPRGYFGYTEMLGDPAYDWAKLYYSVVGNYDRFNLKKFRLMINEDSVDLEIESNGWEDLKDDFFELIGDEAKEADIKLIHAIIWLSLTTYAWEDYDSICGAFYNGLYYLEEAMYGE
jgi:thiamine kinase-like enzyme